jgi:DsbC/DsbD-like thiol-disulfide interchange protein
MSKQLESILATVPPATAKSYQIEGDRDLTENKNQKKETEKLTRVVARIPESLKKELRARVEVNKGETETTIVLKGLKSIGFTVKDEWLIDKRTTR